MDQNDPGVLSPDFHRIVVQAEEIPPIAGYKDKSPGGGEIKVQVIARAAHPTSSDRNTWSPSAWACR